MNKIRKYLPAAASALLMYVVLGIIYPHYQYYIDPDGTSYLTIAKRYANGDYRAAINGYWSPWSCWLTAIVIKMGIAVIPASVIVNTLGATGFLIISQSFFLKFNLTNKLQFLFCSTLGLFLCYAIFWQSFDDLWECFFLLFTLRMIIADSFKNNPLLWVACGALGALAYFAKAYSFPFFILNTVCCIYFIRKNNKITWLRMSIVSVGTMFLISMPWISLLHNKYGIWSTSTAGPLNMSWYLIGHQNWKTGIDLLIPPANKGGLYFWEDPWMASKLAPHFWSSGHLLRLQMLRVGYNIMKFLLAILQLSAFFPVIGIMAVLYLRSKTHLFLDQVKILIISCLLFPLGYVLINFESRYLWYMLPLGMLIGGLVIQKYVSVVSNRFAKFLPYLFAATFLIYPVYCMVTIFDVGKREYVWAQYLKQNNVQGSFTTLCHSGIETQMVARIAYFSGNPFYAPSPRFGINNSKKLIEELKRYDLRYYIAFTPGSLQYTMLHTLSNNSLEQYKVLNISDSAGMSVLLLHP